MMMTFSYKLACPRVFNAEQGLIQFHRILLKHGHLVVILHLILVL